MAVTEIASAIGDWSLKLKSDTPQYILDQLEYFGHIAITSARVDPEAAGDSLLTASRYVGVLRDRSFGAANKGIGGAGMALWLGDEDDKGEIFESPLVFTNSTFSAAITAALPDAVTAGTITALAGTYSGTHVFQSSRKVIDFICSIFDAEWRVNGDGTLDAGEIADLYVTDPKTAILRNRSGLELTYKALDGIASLDSDVKDFTTRVLLIAEGTEAATVSATADINPVLNPYLDIHGNPVKRTRIISEQQTDATNASARAQLQLNRFTSPRDALKLSTRNYDIKGDVAAGDYVWVYDPEAKLLDTANPIDFHGQEIYPLKLRVFQLSWPVVRGMGVQYRSDAGVWIDLSDYIEWETGETSITVGGYNRSLTGVGSGLTEDPGSRPITNSTIPAAPTWNESQFTQSTYQSDRDGLTHAQLQLDWNQPLNTDSSVITDGSQYEIRRRTGANSLYPPTHAEMAPLRHNQLTGKHESPIPLTQGAWEYIPVPWDATEFLMLGLTPGIPYDFQIRAYDLGTPPNVSDWSDLVTVQTRPDTTAPSIPAAPSNIAGSRNAVQVVHTLGRASGGTYNLEGDLNHLEVHVGYDPAYVPVATAVEAGGTMLGKLLVNSGMIRGQIPAVGTFQLNENPGWTRYIKVVAVDHFGNRSSGSDGATQTAELIDSAFISELTVSKVTAGIIAADWLMAGQIQTAPTGARMEMGWYGLDAYDGANRKTFSIDSTTGQVSMVGSLQSGVIGRRIVIQGGENDIRFYPEFGETRYARLYSYIPSNFPNDVALELRAIDSDTASYYARHWMLPDSQALVVSPLGDGGGLVHVSQVRLNQNGVNLQSNQLTASPPFVGGEQVIKSDLSMNINGLTLEAREDTARDGGFLWLGKGNSGNVFFGRKTSTLDAFIRMTTGGGIDFATGGTVRAHMNADGVIANNFLGFGGGPFAGQVNGAAIGNTFGIRDAGGSDPVMDTDGFSARFVKNFVIDHPTDVDRRLVHACTETPEAAVEYSGVVTVTHWGELIEVKLPDYFEALTYTEGRQVWLQAMLPEAWHEGDVKLFPYMPRTIPTYPKLGKFYISSDAFEGAQIAWKVKAIRKDVPQFSVEPLKSETQVGGSGPYTYLMEG
ncbi:MAG: hypothetical protein AB7L09_22260 [Nitrospira sp.]